MDKFFTFKMIIGYIIPMVLIALAVIITLIHSIISGVKSDRIEIFFLSHGYERELFGVPSVGSGAFYGWVRESDGKRVDDRDIRGWSLKQIKEKYK